MIIGRRTSLGLVAVLMLALGVTCSIDRPDSPATTSVVTGAVYGGGSCVPGDRVACNNHGTCNATGDQCDCDHDRFLATEDCAIHNDTWALVDGGVCKPGDRYTCCDHGTCQSDGACACDGGHWEGANCQLWMGNDGPRYEGSGICAGPSPDPAAATCGNGIVGVGESCDDANLLNGDGCDDTCQTEPIGPPAICGDSIVEGAEQCDDGNGVDDDGCTNACTLPACGDGIVQASEQCDDGNGTDGDGCESCTSAPVSVCGNGTAESGEQCDDGNGVDDDGCTNACTLPVCGDGIVQGTETCDDGNGFEGDGCTSACEIAPVTALCTPGDREYCSWVGSCTADGSGCDCDFWFHGDTCTIEADECPGFGDNTPTDPYAFQLAPCNDNGACVDGGGGTPVCSCDPGWQGATCGIFDCATESCDDSNACTDDSCHVELGCQHADNTHTEACYDGDPATRGMGLCGDGVSTCSGGSFGDCVGDVLPVAEVCDNGEDDDCDGQVDEGCLILSCDCGTHDYCLYWAFDDVPTPGIVAGDFQSGGSLDPAVRTSISAGYRNLEICPGAWSVFVQDAVSVSGNGVDSTVLTSTGGLAGPCVASGSTYILNGNWSRVFDVTIRDLTVENNCPTSATVYSLYATSLTLVDTVFRDNAVSNGGNHHLRATVYTAFNGGDLTLTNVVFDGLVGATGSFPVRHLFRSGNQPGLTLTDVTLANSSHVGLHLNGLADFFNVSFSGNGVADIQNIKTSAIVNPTSPYTGSCNLIDNTTSCTP